MLDPLAPVCVTVSGAAACRFQLLQLLNQRLLPYTCLPRDSAVVMIEQCEMIGGGDDDRVELVHVLVEGLAVIAQVEAPGSSLAASARAVPSTSPSATISADRWESMALRSASPIVPITPIESTRRRRVVHRPHGLGTTGGPSLSGDRYSMDSRRELLPRC